MQHGDFNIILGLPDRALPTVDDKFSQTETTSFILLHIVCPYNVVTLCGPEYGECIWIAHHHERKMSVRFYARPQGTLILNRPCNLIPLGNVRRRLSTPLFFVRLVAARQKSWAVSGWHCWLGCCCCHYLLVSEIKISRHGGPRRRRNTPTHSVGVREQQNGTVRTVTSDGEREPAGRQQHNKKERKKRDIRSAP